MKVYLLGREAITWLSAAVSDAENNGRRELRIAIDDGDFKVKVGGGMWSPPLPMTDETD